MYKHLLALPRLYFVDSCRGQQEQKSFNKYDAGTKMKGQVSAQENEITLFSTVEQYTSMDTTNGGLFLQSVVYEFNEVANNHKSKWDDIQRRIIVRTKNQSTMYHDCTNFVQLPQVKGQPTKTILFEKRQSEN